MPAAVHAATLPELLAARIAAKHDADAYRQFDPVSGQWQTLSWRATGERVARWRDALAAMDLPRGARVSILLPNGLDAMSIDQACLARAAVPVPVHALSEWLARGATAAPAEPAAPWPEDLATIVYTSGTTGKPKGVMLTHRNVVANVQAVLQRVVPTPDDVFLSFLPLSHTFERTAGYYLPIAAGSCVAYARSVPQLAEDLLSQRPTVLISVPRIYERVHAKIHETLATQPRRARRPTTPAAPAPSTPCCGRCCSAWWRARCWRASAAGCGWP